MDSYKPGSVARAQLPQAVGAPPSPKMFAATVPPQSMENRNTQPMSVPQMYMPPRAAPSLQGSGMAPQGGGRPINEIMRDVAAIKQRRAQKKVQG